MIQKQIMEDSNAKVMFVLFDKPAAILTMGLAAVSLFTVVIYTWEAVDMLKERGTFRRLNRNLKKVTRDLDRLSKKA